jgi:hypothetical protein
MEVIAAIVDWQEPGRMTRIAKHVIDIDHAVQLTAGANPVVQRHTCGFVRRVGRSRI